jgi:hypothetical protein
MEQVEVLDRAEINGQTVIVEYSKTEAALAVLRGKYENVVFDCTTTKGDKEARSARLDLTTLRTSLEKKRKELKAPALDLGKKIDSEAERVTVEIVKLEKPIDEQIKADEARRAAEKFERDRIEAERIQALQDKITSIHAFVQKCHGISAERIATGIEKVKLIDTNQDVFFEFSTDATAAKSATLQAMQELHAKAVGSEAVAAKVEAQRIENERVAAEQKVLADSLALQKAELDKAAADVAKASALLEESSKKPEAMPAPQSAAVAQSSVTTTLTSVASTGIAAFSANTSSSVPTISAIRKELNERLDKLGESELKRILSFVVSRYELQAA